VLKKTTTKKYQHVNPTMNNIGVEIEETVKELRQYFKTGKTTSVTWRKNQLKAILNLVHENEDSMSKALYQDLGKHPVEAYRDEVFDFYIWRRRNYY
jgi:acyl-CoA reductase-like NAD-dependent aldehyde dehydrogenase